MYCTALVASAALMATGALAQSVGHAIIKNACTYDVYLCNVPASGGGKAEVDQTITKNGGSYTQQWTALSNNAGWSMKLSKDSSLSNIMQYEYTYQPGFNPEIIWFDLSDVNGNPWNGNWEITGTSASGNCTPKQQAYRYATDDAYGMQACPIDSEVTVTLCSGESQDNSGASSASASAVAQSTQASTKSTFSTPSASAPSAYTYVANVASSSSEASATPASSSSSEASPLAAYSSPTSTTTEQTTFATSTTAVITHGGPYGATVTEVQTAVVTDVVTATYWQGHQKRNEAAKRHEHHARRHPHGRL